MSMMRKQSGINSSSELIVETVETVVRMAFRVLDKQGRGVIESKPFKHLMLNVGKNLSFLHYQSICLQSSFLFFFFFKIFFLIKFNIFSDSRFFFSGEVRLTEKDVDTILSEADVNNDGKIDYEEFVKMLTNAEL